MLCLASVLCYNKKSESVRRQICDSRLNMKSLLLTPVHCLNIDSVPTLRSEKSVLHYEKEQNEMALL